VHLHALKREEIILGAAKTEAETLAFLIPALEVLYRNRFTQRMVRGNSVPDESRQQIFMSENSALPVRGRLVDWVKERFLR
jgi:hypothetical protein